MEAFFVLFCVPVLNYLTMLGKKFGLDGKVSLLVMSVVLALVYTLFKFFVPNELQATTTEFVGQVIAVSVFVYEFILKRFTGGK